MRNSTIQRHSEFLKAKNSVNLSDLTAQESSNYRMRFTPMSSPSARHKGTIIIKSHETIVLNMLSSTHRQIDSPYKICQYCTLETGPVRQYCKCKGITYHEKCLQDNARNKVKKIKEQAFICNYDCAYPYRIEGYYMRDINKCGKLLILIIVIILILLIIVWILLCIFWKNLNNLQLLYLFGAQILLLIIITILLRKLKVNYYILHWRLLPYLVNDSQSHHSELSLSTILPFLLQERDVILYKIDKEEDPIIEQ